ncbi:MAG: transglycosylase family protein, partial [Actinomycetota bacterium]
VVALVAVAAVVAAGVARLDQRGEVSTGLIATAVPEPEPTTSTTVAPTGPPLVAVVADKEAAIAQEWEAASAAAAEIAAAAAALEAATTTAPAPSSTAAPAQPRQAAPAPDVRPAPAPAPAPPPPPSGDIYAMLDNIARCESGMNPKAYNPRGPYLGAFQFHPSTWAGLGEGGDPRDKSYEYQREVARRLQQRSGWGSWPSCSAKYGYR